MIPATVLAGSRSDAVICDCGEEIVRLYTYELLPGAIYYAIDGRLFEFDHSSAEGMPVVRAEPISGEADTVTLVTTCNPVRGTFEFRAYAACDSCASKRFTFRVHGDVLTVQE